MHSRQEFKTYIHLSMNHLRVRPVTSVGLHLLINYNISSCVAIIHIVLVHFIHIILFKIISHYLCLKCFHHQYLIFYHQMYNILRTMLRMLWPNHRDPSKALIMLLVNYPTHSLRTVTCHQMFYSTLYLFRNQKVHLGMITEEVDHAQGLIVRRLKLLVHVDN